MHIKYIGSILEWRYRVNKCRVVVEQPDVGGEGNRGQPDMQPEVPFQQPVAPALLSF